MEQNNVENFSETSLKKTLINFERRYNENQKLRIKHAESPTKFASSETELFAALNELQGVATQPELYHIFIARNTTSTLLTLIGHENTDISAKVIHILQEFTDLEDSDDDQESTRVLIATLIKENVVDIIVSNLNRLSDTSEEESQAINHSLDIVDNLIKYDSKVATVQSKTLIEWMIKQFKKSSEFNPIKNSISELLTTLLINSNENKLYLGELGGIEALLQQAAYYRRVAPEIGDEHEYLEQTIDCLCIAMLDCDKNRELFYDEEGVDLIELILREKREAVRKSSIKLCILKLFNHVLTTDKNQDHIVTQCCERFIEVLGLRVIFPLFNNPKLALNLRVKRSEYHDVLREIEEHTSAIILALLKHSQNSEYIQRILVKFAETNFEKINRAIDLHDKYFKLIQNQEDYDNEDDSIRSARFILETIDYILLLTCYLSQQFETYDPISGETFTNYFGKVLSRRPELCHQIKLNANRHIDELATSSAARNTLELLLENFEQLNKVNNRVR